MKKKIDESTIDAWFEAVYLNDWHLSKATTSIREIIIESTYLINTLRHRVAVQEKELQRRRNLLEDVVNELDLSSEMIEKHGPLGTPPAELVKAVLQHKDRMLKLYGGNKDTTRYVQSEDSPATQPPQ